MLGLIKKARDNWNHFFSLDDSVVIVLLSIFLSKPTIFKAPSIFSSISFVLKKLVKIKYLRYSSTVYKG